MLSITNRLGSVGVLVFAGALTAATAWGVTPADKCEAAKNKIAGKYAFCRQKAAAKAIITGDPPDYSKCDMKFADKWATAETDGDGMCPTTADQVSIKNQVTADSNFIALKLAGPRFFDNGDGTVTDVQTGLMWEQKDNLDSSANLSDPHDADNAYSWTDAMSEWLSLVNGYSADGTTQTGLGGHSDWRLPTSAELQTILLAPDPCGTSPCIDPIFGPTSIAFYWSSTTFSSSTTHATLVNFSGGFVGPGLKTTPNPVRAVRGGS